MTPWTKAHQASLSFTISQSLHNLCPCRWCYLTISSCTAPLPFAYNLSQHQGLFQCVSSLYQVAKVLKLQLQRTTLHLVVMLPSVPLGSDISQMWGDCFWCPWQFQEVLVWAIAICLPTEIMCRIVYRFTSFPGGSVMKNLPANSVDTGLIPGLGWSHMARSSSTHVPQLLSPCSRPRELQLLGPSATVTEAPTP